jgi:hypothetical protein
VTIESYRVLNCTPLGEAGGYEAPARR